MLTFFKNPFTIWLKWYIETRIIIRRNKNKQLRIGYLTHLTNVKLGALNTFYDNVKITNAVIGNYVYIASQTKISNTTIGNFCSIGPGVKIGLGMHPTNLVSTFPAFFSTKKQCQITFVDIDHFEETGQIKIGNDVWIGANAIILDNVTVGDGVIIAAGAVVTKNVEPYTIVGGVPAKTIRRRFSDKQVSEITKTEWWNKDIEWLRNNRTFFTTPIKYNIDLNP